MGPTGRCRYTRISTTACGSHAYLSIFPLNMVNLLLFVLLVLLREQIRPVQASFSIALPLAVRSPYLSCWLPQLNGSSNAAPPYHSISPTRSNLSQVCLFI